MNDVLTIKNLNKYYGNYHALKDVNLTVKIGEIMGMIGSNGAGKTTLLKCISGLHAFQSGTILLNEIDVTKNHIEAAKHFGYVADHDIAYNQMTGNEYLEFIASVYNVKPENFNAIKEKYLSKFDLVQHMDKLIEGYSHGMKQKIGLIASIIHEPDLWILDEPIVGLDYYSINTLIEIMQDYCKSGHTILLSSHNLDIVKNICDRYVVMISGVLSEPKNMKSDLTQKDLYKQQQGDM